MLQLFFIFLKLGLTSFGGPVAHLGFFHHEFVTKKKWLNDSEYAELVALCQLLPGPASSQVGMAIGYYRAGVWGSILTWVAFTLPSALLLVLFATSMNSISNIFGNDWLHGLKIAAVAVVAHAVWEMAKKFCTGTVKILITLLTAISCLTIQNTWIQIFLILIGAAIGILFLKSSKISSFHTRKIAYNKKLSLLLLFLFLILLFGLPFFSNHFNSIDIKLADIFYRVGALVFGGGHVVLPLIQTSLVDSGFITKEVFWAGYGAAQAIPGPLFTISAYLGFMANQWMGATVALLMIFLPSFLLIIGALPFWEKIRLHQNVQTALAGVNAVVVGLLIAAFYNPVWTSAVFDGKDFVVTLILFLLLLFKKIPSYLVVFISLVVTQIT